MVYRYRHLLGIGLIGAGLGLLVSLPGASEPPRVVGATTGTPESRKDLEAAFHILGRSPTARGLIDETRRRWGFESDAQLLERIDWATASHTEAMLTRHFDPSSGEERRERDLRIYIKAEQVLPEVVLDLAHELTHAARGSNWDPYDTELGPAAYIRLSVEGAGGEVDALMHECRVGIELRALSAVAGRCQKYGKWEALAKGDFDRDVLRRDFYRVGRWLPQLKKALGMTGARQLPALSPEPPALFSSTGHAPYPVALWEEYRQMTQTACENSRRRVERAPAAQQKSTRIFLEKRCSRINTISAPERGSAACRPAAPGSRTPKSCQKTAES